MPDRVLARRRLVAQGLVGEPWPTPTDAVTQFGLMQGQDLPGVLASAALRSTGGIDDVLAALDAGHLVRGYPMRGTIFLAPAADLRWMTELCAGQSLADAARRRERHHGLGEADIARVADAIRPLARGRGVSRAQFLDVVAAEGIDPSAGRGYHVLFTLIAGGVLCHGPWNGTDQQIVLADEWLGPSLEERFNGDRTAATAELASRYLRTHGPATLRDVAWWTKLPLTCIRAAATQLAPDLEELPDGGWARAGLVDEVAALGRAVQRPLLLPGFDEYVLGYPDRLFAMDAATHGQLVPGNNGVFRKACVVDGVVRGFWNRQGRPGKRVLELTELATVPKAARPGIRRRFATYPFVTS
ncbi:winged helix DNA-binding domain-containing protein [uncultured Tessaracoccus sp.]|uniref:winged helix DNA-binding domain-containing protein n=1 Tax=uncultured Tessaracoccus sp. TaxID=905023 RepID=UPI0025E241F8|nr:winged helix DNA-binding domain-containing protein [uncultured Tessaracoccus sp.]